MNVRARVTAPLSGEQFALWLTAAFLALGALHASHHEMWRDEIQAWLLARDSASVVDLFRHLRYEGHPGLWHLCLMVLTRITPAPAIMQVFSLMIVGASVYLFARFSPFTRWQKVLFAFGYFCVFEYSILSRNYSLGVLLLCAFCVQFPQRYSRFVWLGVTVFLLAQTSAPALICAIAIGGGLFVDYVFVRRSLPADITVNRSRVWLGFGFMALGVIVAVLQLLPPADTGLVVERSFQYDSARLLGALRGVARAMLPVPIPRLDFWGQLWVEKLPHYEKLQAAISCLFVGWFSLTLWRKPTAFAIYAAGTTGLLAFAYLERIGSLRNQGFLIFLFIAVAWIQRFCAQPPRFGAPGRFDELLQNSISPVLTCMLVVHVAGGAIATGMDDRVAFSQGKAVADFIRARDMQDLPMVGEADYAASTVVGYLEKKSFYYPRGHRNGSYIIWDKARNNEVSDAQLVEEARSLAEHSARGVLLVLNRRLVVASVTHVSITALGAFTGAAVNDEQYFLYLLRGASTGGAATAK